MSYKIGNNIRIEGNNLEYTTFNFGAAFKTIRGEESVENFSKKLNISYKHLCDIEKNKICPSYALLFKLMEVCNLEFSDVFLAGKVVAVELLPYSSASIYFNDECVDREVFSDMLTQLDCELAQGILSDACKDISKLSVKKK